MREPSQAPALIRFLRAGVLLGTLILIPGVAVCWNLWPKQQCAEPPLVSGVTMATSEPEDVDVFGQEAVPPIFQAVPVRPEPSINLPPTASPFPKTAASFEGVRTVDWGGDNESRTIPIPTDIAEAPSVVVPVVQNVGLSSQQQFPRLITELETLGVTYYHLEKWGSSGELFRFFCYVASMEPYNYQKPFQAVDSNEIRAMERVITEIKAWRK